MGDEWAVVLPGSPSIVSLVRRWVGEVLRGFPELVEDMKLIASEYATNCVRHSAAAEGGNVHLSIEERAGRLRLEVTDRGPRSRPEAGWAGEDVGCFGRGLAIVAEVADAMGDQVIEGGGRLAWAELAIRAPSRSRGSPNPL